MFNICENKFNSFTEMFKKIEEASDKTRLNTELASLLSLTIVKGKDIKDFDLTKDFNPEEWFDRNKLYGPDVVYQKIINEFTPKQYVAKQFKTFFEDSIIANKKMSKYLPGKGYFWVGADAAKGDNANPADVEFYKAKDNISGISIKDASGITLSNLSPSRIGLELKTGEDAVRLYSSLNGETSYIDWKTKVFKEVISVAKKGGIVIPDSKSPYYSIEYNKKEDLFYIGYDKKRDLVAKTEQVILASISETANWQSIFGVYLSKNAKNFAKESFEVYDDLAKNVVPIIKDKLVDSDILFRMINMGTKPYIYQMKQKVYYVPSISEFGDKILEVKDIVKTGKPDSTSGLVLKVNIGIKGKKEYATIELRVRYANRIFGKNSTVRVQSIKDVENILWKKL